MFVLPQEQGYFKAAGLDVTIDEAATPLEAITRVTSGNYDMALRRHQRHDQSIATRIPRCR